MAAIYIYHSEPIDPTAKDNPETHAFINKRLVAEYERGFVQQNVRGHPYDYSKILESFDKFTLPNDRGDWMTRTIPVKTIPKGTILFTYTNEDKPPRGLNPEQSAHFSFAKMLRHTHMPCDYNWHNNTYDFNFCSYFPNRYYYYPAPCAGFGITGMQKNTCVAVVTQRDLDVAYLKDGGAVLGSENPPSKAKLTTNTTYSDEADFMRVRRCNRIKVPDMCGDGLPVDVCLQPEFAKENNLAGYTAIANEDAIYEFYKNFGYAGDEQILGFMGGQYKKWLERVGVHGNRPEDLFIHYMNMLCVETENATVDGRQRLIFGFPEYYLNPFGEHDMSAIINSTIFDGHPSIRSKTVVNGGGAKPITELRVSVHAAHINDFLETFIYPYSPIRAFNLYNVSGESRHFDVGVASLPELIRLKPPATAAAEDIAEYEYIVNHNIAQSLYAIRDQIMYDLTKNLIILTGYDASTRHEPLVAIKKIDAFGNVVPGVTKGYYDIRIDSIDAVQRAMKIKLHHEVVSCTPPPLIFRGDFMNEFVIKDLDSDELYYIPLGPFYNSLYLDNYDYYTVLPSESKNYLRNLVAPPTNNVWSLQNNGSLTEETQHKFIVRNGTLKRLAMNGACYAHFFSFLHSLENTTNPIENLLAGSSIKDMHIQLLYGAVLDKIDTVYPPREVSIVSHESYPEQSIAYSAPLYNGGWDIRYDDLKFYKQYELPEVVPVNNGTHGGYTNMNRIQNEVKTNSRYNKRSNNMNKKTNRRNKRRQNTKNRTRRNNIKGDSFYKPISAGALNAYNMGIKMGLYDNFFAKFSGKPVKYKTAN